MGKKYLLDTNVIIGFASGNFSANQHKQLAAIIDNQSYISIINKIELLGFSAVPSRIIQFVNSITLLYLDDTVAEQTITLRKKHKIKLPDAIIAATALVHNLTLLTRNEKDFFKIENLRIANSWNK